MTQEDIKRKQLILIEYLQNIINVFDNNWLVKAEYSTNDKDKKVVVVQEQAGQKIVFYGDITPLYNYYSINIYGISIEECKNLSLILGYLIGKNILVDKEYNGYKEKWQIMFQQFTNPQTLFYEDIRRVGYNSTMKCIVNKVYQEKI